MSRSERLNLTSSCVALLVAGVLQAAWSAEGGPRQVTEPGQFGLTLLSTADGSLAGIHRFAANQSCAICHPRQLRELQGAMHSASHTDPLYRGAAELARKEAGEKIYAYCSGCHSSAGVAAGLIPKTREADLPAMAKAGVTCDVCHQISALTGAEGPWQEPGNASFVLQPSEVKYGPTGAAADNVVHLGAQRTFFEKSEFCASCHTVIHPVNGLRIEHTYGEWQSSIYAEKGIHCQDCHMRSVEDAVKVAQTLRPLEITGESVLRGRTRPVYGHYFVGGNANADFLAGGNFPHARLAEQRLRNVARLKIQAPDRAAPGGQLAVDVLVYNAGAGHNLPTGVTELRRMWLELTVRDENGTVIARQGGLDANSEISEGTIRFGAAAANANGEETVKLWEMERFLWKRTIPPKGSSRDTVRIQLPPNLSGKACVEARLFYRSVPPKVVAILMPGQGFVPRIVEMAVATTTVSIAE